MSRLLPSFIVFVLGMVFLMPGAQANTVLLNGTVFQQEGGTTFDTWKFSMNTAGTFRVNLLAYESTSNDIADAQDINGDGEFTYLDPDTYFYFNTGNPLQESDLLARCDDIGNNCSTVSTPTIQLESLTEAQGAVDGSIHFRRDPAFEVTLAAGEYLYLVADYRLSSSEAVSGINGGDSIRNGGDHADYQIALSSDSVNFSVAGDTINVSAIPVPAAIWLFASGLFMLVARRKNVTTATTIRD